jgi:hypothetical protein
MHQAVIGSKSAHIPADLKQFTRAGGQGPSDFCQLFGDFFRFSIAAITACIFET